MAIPTAGATALSAGLNTPHLTLTPDGSRVVYRGAWQILVRALDQIEPTAPTGLGAPQGLFTAPDGQWVGFFDVTIALRQLSLILNPSARGGTSGFDL